MNRLDCFNFVLTPIVFALLLALIVMFVMDVLSNREIEEGE